MYGKPLLFYPSMVSIHFSDRFNCVYDFYSASSIGFFTFPTHIRIVRFPGSECPFFFSLFFCFWSTHFFQLLTLKVLSWVCPTERWSQWVLCLSHNPCSNKSWQWWSSWVGQSHFKHNFPTMLASAPDQAWTYSQSPCLTSLCKFLFSWFSPYVVVP
jgi:hypothetical protein